MKTISLILLLMIFTTISTSAQTRGSAKIYGYVQMVSGGASPDRSEPPGQQNKEGGGTNYFIYLTFATTSRIYPSQMWIKGELYSVQTIVIKRTPVVMETIDTGETQSSILVPKTKHKVIQLVPAPSGGSKASIKAKGLSKRNDVVVVYKLSGKFFYATLKSLTRLPNAAMQ